MTAYRGNFINSPSSGSFPAGGNIGDVLKKTGANAGDVAWGAVVSIYGTIGCVLDAGTGVVGVGSFVDVPIPYHCTILEYEIFSDVAGSATVDVRRSTYAAYPPAVGDSIVAAAPVTLTAATTGKDTALTGWITDLPEGDIIRFWVTSASLVSKITIALKVLK